MFALKKGISPLISSVMIIGVVIISTMLVLSQLLPILDKGKDSAIISEARQAMTSIDKAVQELLYEAPGASRVLDLKVTGGSMRASSKDDQITFYLDTKSKFTEPGSITKQGNLIEAYGPGIKAYESDANGDGETDLVLENDDVLFAIRKLNNFTNPGFVNTTNSTKPLISFMKNKRLGVNMTPIFGIYINNFTNSSFGQGYTELADRGERLPGGTIRLYVSSNASITYEVFFRLLPGQDYIEAEAKIR